MAHEIIAAADGSALGNPGPAGWAWYIDDETWAAGGWKHGTNNMGELKAVLDLFHATAHLPNRKLKVLCDSQYVINSVTKWMPGWKKKGWKKSDGKPVLNVELMKQLDAALAGRNYTFEWVKGHSGHPLNEAADSRANAAARAFSNNEAPNYGPGFGGPHDSGRQAVADELADSTLPPASAKDEEEGALLSASDSSLLDAIFTAAKPAKNPQVEAPQTGAQMAPQEAAETRQTEAGSAKTDTAEEELDAARRCEEQLTKPATYGSQRLVSALLSQDLLWVNPAGRTLDRATVLEHRERAFPVRAEPQLLSALHLGAGAVLLVFRVETARGPVLRSSTWKTDSTGNWKLRYRQETAT